MRPPRITTGKAALAAAALIALVAITVFAFGCGSDDKKTSTEADLQTVSFQKPEDPGPDPFTPPADVEGDDEVDIPASGTGGEQPFGGSGSNRVCDRDKLIRFLKRNPERMREWARVLGVRPTFRAVKKYIAKLHPVTLTRDTQVTNHAFKNGRAVPFQAILQAGTAVLVDKYGTPVVRCFCGNPLGAGRVRADREVPGLPAALHAAEAMPVRPQERLRRDLLPARLLLATATTTRSSYAVTARARYSKCYEPYPGSADGDDRGRLRAAAAPAGAGSDQTTPTPTVPAPAPEPSGGLQCDPPRSQLEAEQCAEQRGQRPREHAGAERHPSRRPPPPGICNDGLDNEGVPGLIDGDDPNCQ